MLRRIAKRISGLVLLGALLSAGFSSCDLFSVPVIAPFAETARGEFDYLIGGDFQLVDGSSQSYVARLDSSGALDDSFTPTVDGAVYTLTTLSWNGEPHVLIGGSFTTVNDAARPGVALLRMDGTLDEGFAPDLGVSPAHVNALLVVPERETVLIGGYFEGAIPEGATSVSTAYKNLAELRLSDGTAVVGFAPAPFGSGANLNGEIFDLARSYSSVAEWRVLVAGAFEEISGTIDTPFMVELNEDGLIVMTLIDPTLITPVDGELFSLAVRDQGESDDYIVSGNSSDVLDATDGFGLRAYYSGTGVVSTPGQFSEQGFSLPQIDAPVRTVSTTPEGSYLIGGDFTQIDEFPGGAAIARQYIAAYNESGLDTSFPVTVDAPVYDAFALPGSSLVIAGSFATSTSGGATGPGYLFRIDSDLAIDDDFRPALSRTDAALPTVRVVRPVPSFAGAQ